MQTKLIPDIFIRHGNVTVESLKDGAVRVTVGTQVIRLTKEEYLTLYQIYGNIVEWD